MAQHLHRASGKSQESHTPSRSTRHESGRQHEQAASNGGQRQSQQGHSAPLSVPMVAIRGFGQLYDMQMAATRIMLQTQANAACAFGWPDFSGLFHIADERAKRVFSNGTEQMLHLAEQANQATSEVQRQLGRMFEFHTVNAAENWQQGMEELGVQAEESLEELKELARQQAEESMRATQALSEQTRETMREGSEQFRQSIHRGLEEGQQNIAQMGDLSREQAEKAGSAIQQGTAEGGEARGHEQRPVPRRKAA